jgi:hypothetical protein
VQKTASSARASPATTRSSGSGMGVSCQDVEPSGTTDEWWLTISHTPSIRW